MYPSFDLRRVNTLELAMLDALKYVIRVSASEYAKYYFHLRSMMARLGLYQGQCLCIGLFCVYCYCVWYEYTLLTRESPVVCCDGRFYVADLVGIFDFLTYFPLLSLHSRRP